MDFLENTQPPFNSKHGMRRSAAMTLSADCSMARYREASSRLSTSFGVTTVPPCRPSCGAFRLPPRAFGFCHELLEGLRHRIWQVCLVEVDTVDPLSVLVCYSARHADDNAVRRH